VLDVGCGTGIFTFYAANLNRSAVGLDGSQKMIDICESKRRELNTSNVEFVQTDVAHIGQVPMERPDLILCSSVLEYLDNLDQMLLSLSSLLMRKGFLLISMPNKTSVYRSMEAAFFKMTGRPRYYRYVRNVLTQEQMRHKLQACGLDILRTEYYADAPLLSRALRGIGFPQYADLMYIMVAQKP
jgi:2-polyprenyl-6-hydroxyphenyl methylase/3-demethylubiquinone-9 3-methyltransferase